jgi:Lon-like ATP-dependent protease
MTGAIDQMGNVQAVGGINQKIEGFYRVCKTREMKEEYGVIIPTQNVMDIMLDDEVIKAARDGQFRIVTVDNIIDAMEVLTGANWGGEHQSLKARCLTTLHHFNQMREQHNRHNYTNVGLPAKKRAAIMSREIAAPSFLEKP